MVQGVGPRALYDFFTFQNQMYLVAEWLRALAQGRSLYGLGVVNLSISDFATKMFLAVPKQYIIDTATKQSSFPIEMFCCSQDEMFQ